MTADAANLENRTPRPQWKLPKILKIRIARVPYEAPQYRHFESVYARYNEAIEFMVQVDEPFPVRALSPVLFVGDTPVTEGEMVDQNVYRFLAFELKKLEQGAPISLGWPGQPAKVRQQTQFRYELADSPQQE